MKNTEKSWFNNWPDGLVGINKHHLIVELSPVAHSILGWSKEEIYGQHVHDVLCAKSRNQQHEREDCDLIKAGEISETTSTLWQHKNGNFVSVDFRIIPVGYQEASRVISFVDNSTRLHNQEEMEKFSEYVQMNPAPLAEFVMDGQLLFGNTALQELLLEYGFDDKGAARAIPQNITEIGQELLNSDKTDEITEVSIEGAVFVWHFHLLSSQKEPTLVGYALDITAQKEAEKIAAEQRSQARKEFYAKMIHELRSPLNAIVGFSDILVASLENKISDEDVKKLKLIKDAGIQLNEQVTATLDVAKIESGKMSLDISEFSIDTVCREVFQQMLPLANEKSLDFEYSCLTKQKIFSDQTKVRQIIINLISNAIKYTKAGEIHLVACIKNDKEIKDCISIVVSDTGIGIQEEQLPKLFKSFEQIEEHQNREIEGTGLGLALVKNLVTLLGGKIEVTSTYGVGSSFEVWLPFMNNRAEQGL